MSKKRRKAAATFVPTARNVSSRRVTETARAASFCFANPLTAQCHTWRCPGHGAPREVASRGPGGGRSEPQAGWRQWPEEAGEKTERQTAFRPTALRAARRSSRDRVVHELRNRRRAQVAGPTAAPGGGPAGGTRAYRAVRASAFQPNLRWLPVTVVTVNFICLEPSGAKRVDGNSMVMNTLPFRSITRDCSSLPR